MFMLACRRTLVSNQRYMSRRLGNRKRGLPCWCKAKGGGEKRRGGGGGALMEGDHAWREHTS